MEVKTEIRRERERERRKIEGNRRRFILKSGLLLSGEGEGGRGRRTDEVEHAILAPQIQYGQASANCLSLPLVPDGERGFSLKEKRRASEKWLSVAKSGNKLKFAADPAD